MNSKPQTILTEDAPAPAGYYSQAVRSGNSLYISGQLPIRADKAPLADTSFEIQARLTIANMLAILEAAGGKPDDLCRVTAYIVGYRTGRSSIAFTGKCWARRGPRVRSFLCLNCTMAIW